MTSRDGSVAVISATRARRISAYAAVYLLWGGAYLAIGVLVQTYPPFFIAGLRYVLAALLLAVIVVARRESVLRLRQCLNAAWTGALMLGLGYGVVFWAEKRLPSWLVAVLASTAFLWTYLGECFVLRSQKFRLTLLAPLLVGLAGVPMLVGADDFRGTVSILSMVTVLVGALCWAAGSLAMKKIEMPRSAVQGAAIQLASAGVLLLWFSFPLGEWAHLPARPFEWQPFACMAYLVVGSSILAFVAFHWLMAHEPASLVATAVYVNPVVAMVLGIAAVHERWSPLQLAGAMAVLASVIVVWRVQGSAERFQALALREMPDQ